jgi:hypothetical protein
MEQTVRVHSLRQLLQQAVVVAPKYLHQLRLMVVLVAGQAGQAQA